MATRFLYTNRWAEGGCTASTSAVSFNPDSTRNPLRALPWRSGTVAGDIWLACNFGFPYTVRAVGLVNPIISGLMGTVKVQSSADGTTWVDVPGGVIPQNTAHTHVWSVWFSAITTQYLRILFVRTAGSGYFEIGTVIAGDYYQPTYSIVAESFQWERNDLSSISKARSGAISKSSYPQYDKFPLHFEQMPAADGWAFDTMFHSTGVGTCILLTVDETNPEYTWYGYFEDKQVKQLHDVPDEYDISLQFSEAL